MDKNDEKVGGSLKPLIKEIRKSRKYYWKLDSANRAIPHLVPEDNEMGYFQLLVFSQFGDRFALYWHAGSGARKIIRKRQQLEELITANRERKFDVNFDEEQILPYLEQDLAPRVRLKSDKYLIIIYMLRESGGLFRKTFSISREAPCQISLVEESELVESNARGLY